MTGSSSACLIESMKSLPMPFQPKIVSVITAPPIIETMSTGTTDASGSSALRRAWRMITVRSLRPLAHDLEHRTAGIADVGGEGDEDQRDRRQQQVSE